MSFFARITTTLLAAILASCASAPRRPAVVEMPPDPRVMVAVDQTPAEQVVVVITNTGGWDVSLDSVFSPEENHPAHEAFVTARRPAPGMIVTQALVERRLKTGVPPREPLRVLLRLAPSTGPDPDQPYAPVR